MELEPEKEFENAKWIVLTTPQPAADEKESAVDDGADKKDSKSSNKDQWGSGQSKMEYASALYALGEPKQS